MRQNLTATFLTARAFLREVARTGHGSLVLVGSTAGQFGEAGHADYAAAKSALQGGLLLSLKNEVARVAPLARVNAVAPGWTESAMTRGLVDRGGCPSYLADDGAPEGRPTRGRRSPRRRSRLGRPLGPRQRPGRDRRRRHGRPGRARRRLTPENSSGNEKGDESLAAPSLHPVSGMICRQSPTRSCFRYRQEAGKLERGPGPTAQMKRGRRQTPLFCAGSQGGNRMTHLRVRRTVALDEMTAVSTPSAG